MGKILTSALESETIANLAYKILGHYITIFMLHRPSGADRSYNGHSLELVEQCVKFAIKMRYHISTPDEIVQDALKGVYPDRPTICFTIDDGFADEAQILAPIFLKNGVRPTLFVLTDFVDGLDWPWDSKISHLVLNTSTDVSSINFNNAVIPIDLSSPDNRSTSRRNLVKFAKKLASKDLLAFLNELARRFELEIPTTAPNSRQAVDWGTLRQLEKQGLIIGSHACSHRLFTSLSDEEIRDELIRSKTRLENELQQPSRVFCYPSGTAQDFSNKHFRLLEEAGYIAAFSAIPGNTTVAQIKSAPYSILRHAFPNDFETFIRYTSWFEALRTKLA